MQVKWKYNVKIFFPQPVGGNTVVEWMNEEFCLLENMLKTLAEPEKKSQCKHAALLRDRALPLLQRKVSVSVALRDRQCGVSRD